LTVSTTTSRADYNGNGTTTAFAVPFYFLDQTHLTVLRTQISTGVITTLALTTNYTVTGAGNPAGGTVTCLVAPTADQKLSILRNVPLTQLNTYVPNDPFPAASHERALDQLTMEVQQLDEAIDRALTLPANTPAGTVSTSLPTPAANQVIGWNNAATGLQNIDAQTLATIVTSGNAYTDIFSGDGVQTAFNLSSNPGSVSNLSVSISGVVQRPAVDYTWVSGTTLTISPAPASGTNNILVQYTNALPQGVSVKDAQTFDTVATVTASSVDVSVNHIRTAGYYAAGDGGGALYKRAASIPAHGAYLTSNSGTVIWEFAEEAPNVKQFGAKDDVSFNSAPAIQAAIDYVQTKKGGTVHLGRGTYRIEATLNMNATVAVKLLGFGNDGIHDIAGTAVAATSLVWYGAANGTVLNVATAVNTAHIQRGPTISDIEINCRSVAGIGILVNSVTHGTFSRVYIESPTIAAIKCTTLGNIGGGEATDTQRCLFDRISWRCIDDAATRAAHGLWITSHAPVGGNANTSLNIFEMCDGQNWGGAGSGYGIFLEDSDNNTFIGCRIIRAGGTTVEAVRLVGSNSSTGSNHFWNLSAGGANGITVRGTASGFAFNPTKDSFWCTDNSNGTLYPTLDAGCIVSWHSDLNVFNRLLSNKMALADSDTQARTEFGNVSNATLRVFNSSSDHARFVDGTNEWGINLASNDFRLNRIAGTGNLLLGGTLTVDATNARLGVGITPTAERVEVLGNIQCRATSGQPVMRVQSWQASGFAPASQTFQRRGAGGNTQTPDASNIGELRFDGLTTTAGYTAFGTINCEIGTNGANGAPANYTFGLSDGTAGGVTEKLRLTGFGNLGIGVSTFGTSATRTLAILNGTEPTSGPADTVQIYSVDRSAGNTIPAIYCEGSGVTNAGITSTAVTHKIALKVNGTVYYLLATTNAT
jgi:hypothetical protein